MNNSTPDITVIIIAYNEERNIKKAITSAWRQSLREIEIVVVDDGSTDATVEVVKSMALRDRRVRLVEHRANRGMVAARVTGIEAARGRYLTFLDADDTLNVDAAERLSQAARQYAADVVLMGCYITMRRLPKRFRYYIPSRRLGKNRYEGEEAERLLLSGDILNNVWGKLYRREMLMSIGLRRSGNNYGEDLMFNRQVFSRGVSVAVTDYMGYNYRMADAGLSRVDRWHDVMTSHEEMIDAIRRQDEALCGIYVKRVVADMLTSIALRLLNPFNSRREIRQFINTELYKSVWVEKVSPYLDRQYLMFKEHDVERIYQAGRQHLRRHRLGYILSYIITAI